MDQKIFRRVQGVRQLAKIRAALEQLCVVFCFWSSDRNLHWFQDLLAFYLSVFWNNKHLGKCKIDDEYVPFNYQNGLKKSSFYWPAGLDN